MRLGKVVKQSPLVFVRESQAITGLLDLKIEVWLDITGP